MEEFRDIAGYEGKYQVSNLGRVKSLKDNHGGYREKLLKQGKDKDDYLTASLWKEGKIKVYKVHRLVAQTFIDNPNNYPCVNHKDENKQNNNVENLEWCTHKYNTNYGTCIQRRVSNYDWDTISKKVYQYTKDGEFVKEWKSTRECGRNGYNSGHVAECCRNELKSYKGFIWKYKE